MYSLPCAASHAVFKHRWSVLLAVVLLAVVLLPGLSSAEEGSATWYGQPFHGRVMYGGQTYNMYDPTTTACNIYPIGTWIKVTNPANGKSVTVQVRDRGGFSHALDLSYAAFAALDDPAKMRIRITYEVVPGPGEPPAPSPPTPAPTPTPAPEPPAPAAPPTEYSVAPGETLFSISTRFGLSTATVAQWNGLANPDLVAAGQVLRLQAPPPAAPSAAEPTSRGAARMHVVAEGDTLWSIATQYDTTPETLIELNGLSEDGLIVIGEELSLPGGAAGAGTSGDRSAPRLYIVQPGDTLLDIALNHGTTVDEILQLNGLSESDFLQIDQELALP